MQKQFLHHINKNFPSLKKQKVIVACSGGVDSVVLVHLLSICQIQIGIAHCNFSLRGEESDQDALFVENLAKELAIPFFYKTFDTKAYKKQQKTSTQIAARELRYQWFTQLLEEHAYDIVVTAHHIDDDLETFLINLSRGTGIKGLIGIPSINTKIIRPLLPFTRQQIVNFAKKEQFYWREDSSNTTPDYLRNALRLQVIPAFKKAAPTLLQAFQTTKSNLQSSTALIEDYMLLIYNLVVTQNGEEYYIDIPKLKELPNTNALLYQLLAPYQFTAWEDIYHLINAQSGKQICSSTHQLLKDRTKLVLSKKIAFETKEENSETFFEKKINKNETQIDYPVKLSFILINKMEYVDNSVIYVDRDKLVYPLIVRKWQNGDYFSPFGMKGNKKLSKFFKDEKLSLTAKKKVWLLCDNNKIVWIIGMRADNYFKVTEKTTQILKITTAQ